MRINKYLAECGVCSRRKSEALILDGRVSIDGKVVTSLAVDVDPENARVLLDGKIVHPINKHIYLKMNKPKGYVCTMADDRGRKTVIDLLPEKYAGKRIFPIGRLDYDTEGLLLLTTDGDLAQALSHPSNEIPKTYIAKIEGSISEAELAKLRKGVEIDGVMTKKCKVKVLEKDEKSTRVEITITEGRNRQIRKMFESVQKNVTFLKRVSVGNIRLGGVTRGTVRELRPEELDYHGILYKISRSILAAAFIYLV